MAYAVVAHMEVRSLMQTLCCVVTLCRVVNSSPTQQHAGPKAVLCTALLEVQNTAGPVKQQVCCEMQYMHLQG